MRCPICNSPGPRWHPATAHEGEVLYICDDPFHEPLNDLERELLDAQEARRQEPARGFRRASRPAAPRPPRKLAKDAEDR